MKTQLLRNTSWLLVLTFCFTQVAPAGLAATNLNDLSKWTGVSATLDPLAEGAKKLEAESKLIAPPQRQDSIAFMLGGSGLSPKETGPLSPANGEGATMTTEMTTTVTSDQKDTGTRNSGILTPEESKEVVQILHVKPSSKETSEDGMCTRSIPPICHYTTTTQYFDRKGNLIGSKEVQVDDPARGETTTTVTWRDANGNLVPLNRPSLNVVVVTDPVSGKELSVTIDKRGNATVKWGDEEYTGHYNARTHSVELVTKEGVVVGTLQFGKNKNGKLHLQSFQKRNWSYGNYNEETYTYNPQGQLVRKDWLTESNYQYRIFQEKTTVECLGCTNYGGYRSGGTIDYVQIKGKTLVWHEKTWSENDWEIYYRTGDMELHVQKTDSIYYPERVPYNHSESETLYTYDGEGNLKTKNWSSTGRYGNSFGYETYVHINGKELVSVRRIWQYGQSMRKYMIDDPMPRVEYPVRDLIAGEKPSIDYVEIKYDMIMMPYPLYVSSHTETYFNYDSQGNLLAELFATEGFDYDGKRHTNAYYWIYNTKTGTSESASAEGLDISRIRSVHDWRIIVAAAQRKTVYVGGTAENPWSSTHRVEYTRNPDGTMTAKAVYDNEGNVSIVLGLPDVLNGGTDDIKIRNDQQVTGKYVYYGLSGHSDADGNWVNDGYRLIFSGNDANGLWSSTAVDFPAVKTVTLDGVEYEILVDPATGLIRLVDNSVKIAIDPVADKDAIDLLGSGLAWKSVRGGQTRYFDADGNLVGSKVLVQTDEHTTVTTWRGQGNGLMLIKKVEIYPDYTNTTLFDSLNRMMNQTFISSLGIKSITDYRYEDSSRPEYPTSYHTQMWDVAGSLNYELTGYNFQDSNGRSFFAYSAYTIANGIKTYFFYWHVAETDSQGVLKIICFMGNNLAGALPVNAHTSMETAAQWADSKTILTVKDSVTTYHEYYKDKAGVWPTKPNIISCDGQRYIVVGDPDELPGQGDDINFTNGLSVQPVGGKTFTASFQVPFFDSAEGHMRAEGIWIYGANETVFVDFPKETQVKIDGVLYEMLISKDGVITLNESLPRVVRDFVTMLKDKLSGWDVRVNAEGGQYRVEVFLSHGRGIPPVFLRGAFTGMDFLVSEQGLMDPSTLNVRYSYDNPVEASLLWKAMERLSPPMLLTPCVGDGCVARGPFANWEALAALTNLTVTDVGSVQTDDEPSSHQESWIYFSLGVDHYKITESIESAGDGRHLLTIRLQKKVPASPALLARAKSVLGEGVANGSAWVDVNVLGSGTITHFYDADGVLVGSYTTNASLGPVNNRPTWSNAQSVAVAYEIYATPELIAKANSKLLGGKPGVPVSYGFSLERVGLMDAPRVTNFYDAHGNFMGSQTLLVFSSDPREIWKDKNGVVIPDNSPIPSAVQAYVEAVQREFPSPAWTVSVPELINGVYKLVISRSNAADGTISQMELTLNKKGKLDLSALKAFVKNGDREITPLTDSRLLYQVGKQLVAAKTLASDRTEVFGLKFLFEASNIKDENGKISFSFQGNKYQAWRNQKGAAILRIVK